LNKKIFVLLVGTALLVGVISGCIEEEKEEEPENNAPTASFTSEVDHNTTMAGGTVTFDSTATDADEDDITYSWDFGDGETSDEADPAHVYAANGTYTVTLTVSDGTDTYTTDEVEVIVGNIAPTALFTYEATNLSVVFTDASTDPNDDTLTYSWDFDGDDTADNTTGGPITYDYTAAGTYNATLTVTDSFGLTDDYTVEITVAE